MSPVLLPGPPARTLYRLFACSIGLGVAALIVGCLILAFSRQRSPSYAGSSIQVVVWLALSAVLLSYLLWALASRKDRREAESGYTTLKNAHPELPLIDRSTGVTVRQAVVQPSAASTPGLSIIWHDVSDRNRDAPRGVVAIVAVAVAVALGLWLSWWITWAPAANDARLFVGILGLVGVILAAFFSLTMQGHFGRRRTLRRQFPDADILSWQRWSPAKSSFVRLWNTSAQGGNRPVLRANGSLVLRNGQLEVWQGDEHRARSIVSVPLAFVSGCRHEIVDVFGQSLYALVFDVVVGQQSVPLVFFVSECNKKIVNNNFAPGPERVANLLRQRHGQYFLKTEDSPS